MNDRTLFYVIDTEIFSAIASLNTFGYLERVNSHIQTMQIITGAKVPINQVYALQIIPEILAIALFGYCAYRNHRKDKSE